jgi:hypothetical protein
MDAPGVLHHVMARGIERRKIFLDDKERDDFVRRLAAVAAGGVYWACRKLEADAKILAKDIERCCQITLITMQRPQLRHLLLRL